jgi:hypothetical protein
MRDYLFVRIPKTASSSVCQALYGTEEWPQHKTAGELAREIGDEFNKVFKFSIVRNPYERFRSMCRFFGIMPDQFYKDIHFKTQEDFLYIKGRLAVDYVGRFEDIDNSFKEICKHIGIEKTLLPHIKPHLGDLPDRKEIIPIVNKYFKRDFELFGYPMEL